MNARVAAAALIWPAAAVAQPGEITRFVLSVDDTGNHNGIIEPGEAALLSVYADLMDDGISSIGLTAVWNTNGGSGQPATLNGFSDAVFDVVSVMNGHSGRWSELSVTPSLNMLSMVGTPQPNGSVKRVVAAQVCVFWFPCDQRDPIPLWSGVWTPTDYSPRSVEFRTLVDTVISPHKVGLTAQLGQWVPVFDVWDVRDTEISFQVVPAPASCLGVAVAALGVAVRRRR